MIDGIKVGIGIGIGFGSAGVATGIKRAGALLAVATMVGAALAAPAAAHEADGHPAKLHEGTCDELGGVAFGLNGVGAEVDLEGTPVAAGEAVNPDRAYQVMRSETALDASLDDLLAAPLALMVYESDEDLSAISCGDLGGNRLGDELAVGLGELGMSGHTGIALFEEEGGTTTVRIFLGHALSPIGASGSASDHDATGADSEEGHTHEEGDDHDQADVAATPETGA